MDVLRTTKRCSRLWSLVSLAYKGYPCLYICIYIASQAEMNEGSIDGLPAQVGNGQLTEFPVLRKRRLTNNFRSSYIVCMSNPKTS